MEILDGPATELAIRQLLSEAKQARIAVSYWGRESVKRLDLASLEDRDVIIVGDVLSGGCNVTEIKNLQEIFGSSRVYTLDRLHAKVWITDKGAIIGSSNASANGLGFEGTETSGLVEANILIREPAALKALYKWFETNVTISAREITTTDLKRGARRHALLRQNRPTYAEVTLLDLARNHSEELEERNIFIWIYAHENHDPRVEKALSNERKVRHNSKIECWSEIKPYPAGAYVIDFDSSQEGPPQCHGIYRILMDDHFVRTEEGNMLLAVRVPKAGDWKLGSVKEWRTAAARAVGARGKKEEWQIADFANKFVNPLLR